MFYFMVNDTNNNILFLGILLKKVLEKMYVIGCCYFLKSTNNHMVKFNASCNNESNSILA